MGELDKNASVIALVYLYKEARFEDHTACAVLPGPEYQYFEQGMQRIDQAEQI